MRLIALLVFLLTACSGPITLGLQDSSLYLNKIFPTQGYVIYPNAARSFERPVLGVKTAIVQGIASATGLSQPISLVLYARAADPSSTPTCKRLGALYLCQASGETAASSPLSFPAGAGSQGFALNGEVLVDGINQGQMWLGAQILSGSGSDIRLEFSKLLATISFF